jgi:predicted CXXCH cytochrome family protein
LTPIKKTTKEVVRTSKDYKEVVLFGYRSIAVKGEKKMKRTLILVATILLTVSPVFAQKANIAGSPHDMLLTNGASGCSVCHTPHNSASTLAAVLLWNPTAASGTFATYTGSVITATPVAVAAPTVATDASTGSYMCLSCHDGTAATANWGADFSGATWNGPGTLTDGVTAPSQPSAAEGTLVIQGTDTDLTNDHPVNFTYPADGVEPAGFANLTAATAANFKFFGATTDSMQCATCHDPHDQDLPNSGFFLRTGAADITAFCTQCHL